MPLFLRCLCGVRAALLVLCCAVLRASVITAAMMRTVLTPCLLPRAQLWSVATESGKEFRIPVRAASTCSQPGWSNRSQ